MSTNLNGIETIILVMMENRSFDHLLGYLSLPPVNRPDVEGLKASTVYANTYEGHTYSSFKLNGVQILEDPPHERDTIAIQLGSASNKNAPLPMDGFVKSYAQRSPVPQDLSLVMGYHTAEDVPIYDFFAKNFAICDHWFSSLPSGTQANRLMAMSGETLIDRNATFLLPEQDLVYDWLEQHNISWCSYNYGRFPFFSLMEKWQRIILEDFVLPILHRERRFRHFKDFHKDWQGKGQLPSVIFIEPEYTDVLDWEPNDDHPPTALNQGQHFIQTIYQTLISNPERWSKTLMIVTYDEHGGCYDHVSPLRITTNPPISGKYEPFLTTGVRVPAFIVSPYVEAGTVHHDPLDHTSFLHLLAEKFDTHQSYSKGVDDRQQFLGKLSSALNRKVPRQDLPKAPSIMTTPSVAANRTNLAAGANANVEAFKAASTNMKREHPDLWLLFEGLSRLKVKL